MLSHVNVEQVIEAFGQDKTYSLYLGPQSSWAAIRPSMLLIRDFLVYMILEMLSRGYWHPLAAEKLLLETCDETSLGNGGK